MKACVFTLGCKLNETESESIMRALSERGYETTDSLSPADVYFLNTCAVTAEAEKKSRQAVARMRKFNPCAPIYVFGCAAQNDPEAFAKREGVQAVAGAMCKDKVVELLGSRGVFVREEGGFCELPAPIRAKTRAFLRVQDGCDRFCSYCLIPYLRGRSRSRALESVVREAEETDAKEIVLTGVDLSSYRGGTDLKGLISALGKVKARIRLGSLEVSAIDDGLLSVMKETGNVCPHFHLSLQSGSDRVLSAMNRKYTRKEYLAACEKIYTAFPDAAITTDLIVGFPDETEEDFLLSLSMIEEAGFARVHAFPFSPREGTRAAKLNDLPASVKKERMGLATRAAEEAEHRYRTRFLGRELCALFEEDGGYTENYLRVRAEGAREGSLCRVRIIKEEKDGVFAEISEVIS